MLAQFRAADRGWPDLRGGAALFYGHRRRAASRVTEGHTRPNADYQVQHTAIDLPLARCIGVRRAGPIAVGRKLGMPRAGQRCCGESMAAGPALSRVTMVGVDEFALRPGATTGTGLDGLALSLGVDVPPLTLRRRPPS